MDIMGISIVSNWSNICLYWSTSSPGLLDAMYTVLADKIPPITPPGGEPITNAYPSIRLMSFLGISMPMASACSLFISMPNSLAALNSSVLVSAARAMKNGTSGMCASSDDESDLPFSSAAALDPSANCAAALNVSPSWPNPTPSTAPRPSSNSRSPRTRYISIIGPIAAMPGPIISISSIASLNPSPSIGRSAWRFTSTNTSE